MISLVLSDEGLINRKLTVRSLIDGRSILWCHFSQPTKFNLSPDLPFQYLVWSTVQRPDLFPLQSSKPEASIWPPWTWGVGAIARRRSLRWENQARTDWLSLTSLELPWLLMTPHRRKPLLVLCVTLKLLPWAEEIPGWLVFHYLDWFTVTDRGRWSLNPSNSLPHLWKKIHWRMQSKPSPVCYRIAEEQRSTQWRRDS